MGTNQNLEWQTGSKSENENRETVWKAFQLAILLDNQEENS